MEPMNNHPLRFLVLMMAGWMNRRQQDVIAYLQEENRVLYGENTSRFAMSPMAGGILLRARSFRWAGRSQHGDPWGLDRV
jgi:hypothetical protein